MAFYQFDDATLVMDSTAGTTVNITASILEIGVPEVEGIMEESHTMGDSWREFLFAGLRQAGEMTLVGFYDDAASTGFDAMLNDPGNTKTAGTTTRSVVITFGGTKTASFEAWIRAYRRRLARGTVSQAEQFQNRLYGKYDSVRLVRSPMFSGAGVYVWEVK